MEDLGAPASYLTLTEGRAVFSSDGERVGEVTHVLADPEIDVFDGVVIDAGGHRFVDADHVEEIFERGVLLRLDAAAARSLPEPSANPAAMAAEPDDTTEGELQRKLRRAWDLISGRG